MHMMRRQSDRRRFGARGGAAAVEFALTAPILFLFLFAALEFCRLNMVQQTAINAAFEAARACVVPGATAATGQTAAQTILNAAGIKNATITMNPSTITNQTTTITATVSVPMSSNLWVIPSFTGTATTSKSCTMTLDWVYSAR